MKKILSALLVLVMVLSLAACGGDKKDDVSTDESTGLVSSEDTEQASGDDASKDDDDKEVSSEDAEPQDDVDLSKIKVGLICLHDENSTYDLNFIDAMKQTQKALNLRDDQIIYKKNVAEKNDCYEAAVDLVDRGCNVIFADSFGHEPYMIQAAKEFKNVQFCHSTGTRAHTENLPNYHNAFASIYQGRYLAGIAAGMKLNEMIAAGKFKEDEAKMGYVGAYTYAEVISGYTSFYLGAKSVCPSVTMDVQFTGSWYDEAKEKEAAIKLIESGCKLISQHADSMGAPTACEDRDIPNVSYNGSTLSACPKTFIVSSRICWSPYYELAIKSVAAGKAIPADWCGGIKEGSVVLTDVNEAVAAKGTQEAINAAIEKFNAGELDVFVTDNFTVEGEKLTSFVADVDTDDKYTPDTEVISDGVFHESTERSAPYFTLRIDGINTLNEKF